MIDELEGRAPQRVIADVKLTCQEEFVLEDGEGRIVHEPEPPCHRKVLNSTLGQVLQGVRFLRALFVLLERRTSAACGGRAQFCPRQSAVWSCCRRSS